MTNATRGEIHTFSTTRLLAERLRENHFDDLCRLYQDPWVTATLTADGQPQSDAEVRVRLSSAIEHWNRHNFGLWAFREQQSGEFVGRGGMQRAFVQGRLEVEVAYAVLPEFWGQGFATEMAKAADNECCNTKLQRFQRLTTTAVVSHRCTHNHVLSGVFKSERTYVDSRGQSVEREHITLATPPPVLVLGPSLSLQQQLGFRMLVGCVR